jgi:hypothetical protein
MALAPKAEDNMYRDRRTVLGSKESKALRLRPRRFLNLRRRRGYLLFVLRTGTAGRFSPVRRGAL